MADLDALINDLNEFAKKPDPELDDILKKLDEATLDFDAPKPQSQPQAHASSSTAQPSKPAQTQNSVQTSTPPTKSSSSSNTSAPLIKSHKTEENLFPWQQEELRKREGSYFSFTTLIN